MTPLTPHTYGERLACVIVSYYSSTRIVALLESIERSSFSVDELVIVNNASDDDLTIFGREHPTLTVVNPGHNLGYGAGVNIGVAQLDSSVGWIVVANPDTLVSEDALRVLVDAARNNPNAGVVGPRITDDAGVIYPSARELPSLRNGIGHALLANLWKQNPWSRRYKGLDRKVSGGIITTGWVSGAFFLIRRERFEELGGFDDSFFMYFEDVDLGRRLLAAGRDNLYVEDAVVVHEGAHSTRSAAGAMRRAHHDSAYLYLSRKYSGWWLFPLRLALKVALFTRARLSRNG